MARRAPGSSGGAKVTGKAPSVAQLAESVNITLYFNSCVGRKYSPPGRAKRARPYGSCYRFEPNTSTVCIVTYNKKHNEYGIIIHDGGTSYVLILYCPWCGTKLPESLRGE